MWLAMKIPKVSWASCMKPATSLLAPEMTSPAASSITETVIASPGRNTARGGISARNPSWSRSRYWAPTMHSPATSTAASTGVTVASTGTRSLTVHMTPTMKPSTVAAMRLRTVGSITRASPAENTP